MRPNVSTFVFIDTETSGIDDEPSHVVELAAREIVSDGLTNLGLIRSWTFRPPEPDRVSARASAIHHLTDASLAGCPVFDEAAWKLAVSDDVNYVVAHNVIFDRAQVAKVVPSAVHATWLCTLKMARVAWPDAPSHGLQALRYHLGLTGDLSGERHPHRAGYDVAVGSWLLAALLEKFSEEEMIRISSQPSLLSKIGFGKHRGSRWRDAPRDYLAWVVRQDFDEDVLHTARYWLNGGDRAVA